MANLMKYLPLLFAAFAATCAAQQAPRAVPRRSFDLAVTYVAERGKVAESDCGCFWLSGGAVDGAFSFFHGLGVAANVTGGHAASITTGVDLDKIAYAAGPRYTWQARHADGFGKLSLFGEGLAGGVHAFHTVLPAESGVVNHGDASLVMLGGGVGWRLRDWFGIRVVEAHYVRSTLPNNSNDLQEDFRLAAGVSLHLAR